MNSKYKQLLSDTLVFAVGNALIKLIQFVLMPVYTLFLTTSEYGIAELMNNTSELLYPLACLAIYDAVFRYSLEENVDKGEVLSSGIALYILLLPLVFFVGIVATFIFEIHYAILVMFLCVFAGIRYICVQFTRGINRPLLFAGSGVLGALTILLCAILYLGILKLGIVGYLLSYITGHMVTSIFAVLRGKLYRYISSRKVKKEMVAKLVRYSLPMVPNGLTWSLVNFIDRSIVLFAAGASAAGLFTAAGKLPAVINMVSMIVQQALQIFAAKEIKSSKKDESFSKVFSAFSSLLLLSGSFVIAMTEPLAWVTLKGDFFEARQFVPLLIDMAILSAYASYFATFYNAIAQTGMIMVTTVIGAVVNILLALVLVVGMDAGAWGAVIASVVAYLVIALMRYFDTKKYVRTDIDHGFHLVGIMVIAIQTVLLSLLTEFSTPISIAFFLLFSLFSAFRYRGIIIRLVRRTL